MRMGIGRDGVLRERPVPRPGLKLWLRPSLRLTRVDPAGRFRCRLGRRSCSVSGSVEGWVQDVVGTRCEEQAAAPMRRFVGHAQGQCAQAGRWLRPFRVTNRAAPDGQWGRRPECASPSQTSEQPRGFTALLVDPRHVRPLWGLHCVHNIEL